MAKIGRNDTCACGSGKKSKRCCGTGEAGLHGSRKMILLAVAGALAAAIIGGLMASAPNDDAAAGRTWSAEHGHFHAP